jgi:hypothetical protein
VTFSLINPTAHPTVMTARKSKGKWLLMFVFTNLAAMKKELKHLLALRLEPDWVA